MDGRKIGIIGYVTKESPHISNPGKNVRFMDEIQRYLSLITSLLISFKNITMQLRKYSLKSMMKVAKSRKSVLKSRIKIIKRVNEIMRY